ncbi:MAG: type II toxin-antitoxin system PemK/MazF family toxin [Planctomycetia bacterium]|nr:type II toxin-antitoxin system PemK/MazF family toxin [Planctomycetia bacterium]
MKRGEIYVVDLGPGIGREANGVRPVVVISSDVDNLVPFLVTIVPAVNATELTAVTGILVPASESGYSVDIAVLARQPRSLDPSPFPDTPVGTVPVALMDKIGFALKVHLDLK